MNTEKAEEAEKKLKWLRSKAPEIREEVGRRIVLKFLPKFEYILDHSALRGARILQALDEIDHPPANPRPKVREGEDEGDDSERRV